MGYSPWGREELDRTERLHFMHKKGFLDSSVGKESACNVGDIGSISGSGRFPWRRKWQPTAVFLPGESHGRGAWRVIVHGVLRVRQD